MNKKVLKVMIGLIVAFLVADYVLKFFFPEEFVMMIENERLVAIGEFIDKHPLLRRSVELLGTFITYWLYINAVTEKRALNWREFVLTLITVIANHFVYDFDINLAMAISVIAMIGIPAISNARLRPVALVYGTHYLAQTLSTAIRSLPARLHTVNILTSVCMTLECYFWLLLYYLIYNCRKEEHNGKNLSTTLW